MDDLDMVDGPNTNQLTENETFAEQKSKNEDQRPHEHLRAAVTEFHKRANSKSLLRIPTRQP